jgi:hypothetical protein
MNEAKRNECTAQPPCSAVEAFKIACKLADALKDQCRYMVSIGEEPSELAKEALGDALRAGYMPNNPLCVNEANNKSEVSETKKRSDGMEITSADLLACPFCGQTPDKIEYDHLGAFVWHQSTWCPISAPLKMSLDVWQRREKANSPLCGKNAVLPGNGERKETDANT